MKFTLAVFAYTALLVPTLFAAACLWESHVAGVLYRCTDSVPILDFFPPFVHSSGHNGDVYLVSPAQVYSTWYAYLGTSLLLPALPILLLFALHWKYWRRSEEVV